MQWNIVCGGEAGQGVNVLASVICNGLAKKGLYVFSSREYESRIRGGHNYNVITFSDKPVNSNEKEIDVLLAMDEKTVDVHKWDLRKGGIIIEPGKENMYYAGVLFKLAGIDFDVLDDELKKLGRYDENIKAAKEGYDSDLVKLEIEPGAKDLTVIDGSKAFADGAVAAGVEFYYGYPMTPATRLFAELSRISKDRKEILEHDQEPKSSHKALDMSKMENVQTVGVESEIAGVNAAIGSAITGAKTMTGTSGGGFDLMTEGLSLAGKAGIPVVFYLAQRHGASTGVPTFTGQGDLNIALYSGHGEFPRIVIAPGDAKEAIEKTTEMFYLTQKYQVPGILIADKHLAESVYSFSEKPEVVKSEKSIKWPARFTSYESDRKGNATEDVEEIKRAAEERKDKGEKLRKEIDKIECYKVYGKKDSKNLVIGWGSTKGAIIDAIDGLDCKFLHILYLEPFSDKIKEEAEKANKIIVVENNSTSPLSSLLTKNGINVDDKILKYDGLAFLSDELAEDIKERLR